jgi:ABC-type multidrug transport system ATPase subunit
VDKILSIENLNKKYGRIHAVNNLNLEINRGDVYGILGPNGSGKTTTLGIILGVINADTGSFSWFGKPNTKGDRKRIGSILEQPIFYPYLSAVKNLKIITDIKGVNPAEIDRVLEIVDLTGRKDYKFRTFSYGMKQRLAIGAALLGNPDVLIFDEPTNGLDPKGIAEIRELIIEIAKKGITIILASHLLDEVQKTCSHVAVLKSGVKLFAGKVSDVLNTSDSVELSSENLDMLSFALYEFSDSIEVKRENDLMVVRLKEGTSVHDLNQFLVEKGIILTHLSKRKKSLEDQFLELLTENA